MRWYCGRPQLVAGLIDVRYHGVEHPQGLIDDLDADTVPGNDRDAHEG